MRLPPIIITRAQPGADETAARVRALGLTPIVSPALSLRLMRPVPQIPISGAAGILFTSANGVRFYSEVNGASHLPAFCVGPATFEAAQASNFATVLNADGNSQDLIRLVMKSCDPRDGHLIHIANTAAAGSVKAELEEAGFDVRFVGLYTPEEARSVSIDAGVALGEGPTFVLIHSAKGASSFAKQIAETKTQDIVFICVSDKAAMPISHLGNVRLAARPNEEELLRELKDWRQAL